MTGGVLLGVALALLASIALNGSFLLQHLGSRTAVRITIRRPVASLRGLLGSRLWLAGSAAGLAGWGVHVAALSQAPLSLVQAFSAGGLALATPLAARVTHAAPAASERRAVLVMVGALVLLSVGVGPPGPGVAAAALMAAFLAVSAAAAAAFAAAPAGGRRAHGLGVAAGVLYGAADAATKAATAALHHGGVLAAVLSPWVPVVAVASAGAFFCFQRGLQIGPALPVIALMTAATNVVAIAGGLAVFAEPLGASVASSAVHVVAFALVGAAAWRLSLAQARMVNAGV
jgi:hypothetical protein